MSLSLHAWVVGNSTAFSTPGNNHETTTKHAVFPREGLGLVICFAFMEFHSFFRVVSCINIKILAVNLL